MTKLTMMDLPKNKPMEFCEDCKSWVPSMEKHKRKRHNPLGNERK